MRDARSRWEPTSARGVADAVLYEGYVLYPYRAGSPKNQVRWQWGVLMPEDVVALDPSERSFRTGQVVVDGRRPVGRVTVRFLQVQHRSVERWTGRGFEPVGTLDVGDATFAPGTRRASARSPSRCRTGRPT